MEITSQIYLQFMLERGSVTGEALASGYESRIDVTGFEFNAKTKIDTLKGITAKTVKHNLDVTRVSISKVFDNASLQLAGMLKGRTKGRQGTEREGVRFIEAKLSVDQQYIDSSVKYANEILILTLYDGYVASIKLRTSESGAGAEIVEDIELSFHDFEFKYYAEDRSEDRTLMDTWRPGQNLQYKTTNRADQRA